MKVLATRVVEIGEPGGPFSFLNLKPLHRNVIFTIQTHFMISLAKVASLLSVTSSASLVKQSHIASFLNFCFL